MLLTTSTWFAGDFFLPAMEQQGYSGAFYSKPCSPAEQYGAPCDGCAIFYKSQRFRLLHEPQGKLLVPAIFYVAS